MKKIVSLLLAVLMVLSMLPVMAFADELQQIDLNAEEQQSEEENKSEEPESKMRNAVLLSGGVTVELKGVHSAQTASLKVYSYDGKVKYENSNTMVREEIIQHIVRASGEDPIVSTTGKASRELFETRTANGQAHKYDFLTVGSMGHSSS